MGKALHRWLSRVDGKTRRHSLDFFFSLQVCYSAGTVPPVSTDSRDKCRHRIEEEKMYDFALYARWSRICLLFQIMFTGQVFVVFIALVPCLRFITAEYCFGFGHYLLWYFRVGFRGYSWVWVYFYGLQNGEFFFYLAASARPGSSFTPSQGDTLISHEGVAKSQCFSPKKQSEGICWKNNSQLPTDVVYQDSSMPKRV